MVQRRKLWEVAIKHSLGREDFRVEPVRLRRGLLDNGWRELAVSSEHAVATLDLPPLHKDPFDRMLLAQARFEGLSLVTSDEFSPAIRETCARFDGMVAFGPTDGIWHRRWSAEPCTMSRR